jgi:DNA topoisomerase-1
MAKNLVIVESPAKAKTINKILGRDYAVEASMGHVRDLPVRTLGVDVDKGFEPKYVNIRGRAKVIDRLKKAARGCEAVYLAPDPDREGEAIAWHLAEVLKPVCKTARIHRVQYNEITPAAVRRAFEQCGEIDRHRVDAQQARRVLDRLVGYMVSPILWRRIRRGLSAGRVQSVALRLVCEREEEIEKFVPEAYWVHGVRARKRTEPRDPFEMKLARVDGEKADIRSEEASGAIQAELEGRELTVRGSAYKDLVKRAPPPYITSTLQQAGSSHHGFSPKRTMMLAQSLYEGVDLGDGPVGLITYMRTDSVHLADEALQGCRAFIHERFGAEFCPAAPNRYRSRAGAQEAHEAIRPTDVNRTPESLSRVLDPAMLKLYTLVWNRFVACQMAPARLRQRTVTAVAAGAGPQPREFVFTASTTDIVFPGYMTVTGAERRKAEGRENETPLPALEDGEVLDAVEWLAERKETQPPPRYSETSLVGALERNGVGRPSTYAQIISTLYDREYVESEKRMMRPTALGRRVNELLVGSLGELFDVTFTAGLEKTLDDVEEGRVEWTHMMGDFYERFQGWLKNTRLPPAPAEKVTAALELLADVREWAPPVRSGKRAYADEKFVQSVREEAAAEGAQTSTRQFEALVRLALKYAAQVPDFEMRVRAAGLEPELQKAREAQPLESTLRKLDLLAGCELDAFGTKFVASLRQQTASGRRLSPAQLRVLDRLLAGARNQLAETDLEGLEVGAADEAAAEDPHSGPLLEALEHVREWKAPVKRGKRTFDDREFHASLKDHFKRKGALTERQLAALQKMVRRYAEQVPGYEELAAAHGIQAAGRGRAEKPDDESR